MLLPIVGTSSILGPRARQVMWIVLPMQDFRSPALGLSQRNLEMEQERCQCNNDLEIIFPEIYIHLNDKIETIEYKYKICEKINL